MFKNLESRGIVNTAALFFVYPKTFSAGTEGC